MTREEAIKWGNEWLKDEYLDAKDAAFIKMAIKALEQEPKIGHWITHIKSDRRGDYWPTNPKCSECDGEPYYSNGIFNYKFCPYCGAKMVETQESEEYCDRNICVSNEYNGIGCDECEVTKSREPQEREE